MERKREGAEAIKEGGGEKKKKPGGRFYFDVPEAVKKM